MRIVHHRSNSHPTSIIHQRSCCKVTRKLIRSLFFGRSKIVLSQIHCSWCRRNSRFTMRFILICFSILVNWLQWVTLGKFEFDAKYIESGWKWVRWRDNNTQTTTCSNN
jgi:hypothetical protein